MKNTTRLGKYDSRYHISPDVTTAQRVRGDAHSIAHARYFRAEYVAKMSAATTDAARAKYAAKIAEKDAELARLEADRKASKSYQVSELDITIATNKIVEAIARDRAEAE